MRQVELRGDREPVALGDDPPLARDDVHHAAAGRLAARLRRRDAARTSRSRCCRDRLGRLLDDLHRDAAPRGAQGARARVRAAQGRGPRRRSSTPSASRPTAGRPTSPWPPRRRSRSRGGRRSRRRSGGRRAGGRRAGRRGRPAGGAPQAAPREAAWPSPLTTRGAALRETAEELFLAGVGAVALTKDRADELVERAGRARQDQRARTRRTRRRVIGRWRGEALRVGERAGSRLSGLFRELGLVDAPRVRGARAPARPARAPAAPARKQAEAAGA